MYVMCMHYTHDVVARRARARLLGRPVAARLALARLPLRRPQAHCRVAAASLRAWCAQLEHKYRKGSKLGAVKLGTLGDTRIVIIGIRVSARLAQ